MNIKAKWLSYHFDVGTKDSRWTKGGGIYVFCGINQAGQWVPLYIGLSSSLAERFATHERWSEAEKLGATHVHALKILPPMRRKLIEQELIQHYQPPLNVQLK